MNDSSKFWAAVAASTLLILLDGALIIASAIPMWLFWVILVVSLVPIFVPILSFKGAQASVSDGRLRVKAPFVDLDIPLSSIQAVECRRGFDIGFRVYGYGGISSGSGDFTNDEFGAYTFAGSKKIPVFVVVRHSDRRILAFNVHDEAETMSVYRALVDGTDAKGPVMTPEESSRAAMGHRSMRNVMIAITAICIVVVVAIVAVVMVSGHVDVRMDEDSLEIDATMMHEDIPFDEISHIELRDDVDYGMRTGGFGGMDISSGNFRNDGFGDYRLAIHNDVDLCIVVHMIDGDTVVFNLGDRESTESFYRDLLDRLGTEPISTPAAHPGAWNPGWRSTS